MKSPRPLKIPPRINLLYTVTALVQFFVIFLCGSYLNTALVCIAWTVRLLGEHEHSVVICVLSAISIVLQAYTLSANSQSVLMVSSRVQESCKTMGISSLESMYSLDNIFRQCEPDLFVPFIPQVRYQLSEDPTNILMYGTDGESSMKLATCESLGLKCFKWKILLPEFGLRHFEPCWALVRSIHVLNSATAVMLQKIPSTLSGIEYYLNMTLPSVSKASQPLPLEAKKSRFVHFSSHLPLLLPLLQAGAGNEKQVDSVKTVPDSETTFVLFPDAASTSKGGMQISLASTCAMHPAMSLVRNNGAESGPFFHSGILHLATAATPGPYTIYSAFSGCTSTCNSRVLPLLLAYLANIVICASCVVLTHTHSPLVPNIHSAVYVFGFTIAIVTFNWIALLCVVFFTPPALRHHLRFFEVQFQYLLYFLHATQLGFLCWEIFENQVGFNSRYILGRMGSRTLLKYTILPFTLTDSNIYMQNCALYLCTSCYLFYLLYVKWRV